MNGQQKHVVVVGGGFAGVNLIRKLAKDQRFRITLVDKNNYNFFPPLVYQVAAGFLEPSNISYPFRKLFHKFKNVSFRMADFQRVIPEENKIIISNGEISYDYLVFATGTQSNFFGIGNVMKQAVPMKTINDAIELRNYLLQTIEKATVTTDERERQKLLTIVVAGGGPSGVEISGILAEMKNGIYRKEYPELVGNKAGGIYLVDANAKVLSAMSEKAQDYSHQELEKKGVRVMLNRRVKDFVDGEVVFAEGEGILTSTLIWTAGVVATELPGLPAESIGRGRRVLVDAYNKVQNTNNIYAIGDISFQTTDAAFPNGHPQLAQVAIQQGVNLAHNLRLGADATLKPFKYNDKGSMAIIGKAEAVADIGRLHFKGFLAALIWGFIHVWSLISYRNRFKTFFNWLAVWFTRDVAMRFIFRPGKRL